MNDKAIEKIINEIDTCEGNNFIIAIGSYLLKECKQNKESQLSEKILNPMKTLEKCSNYICNYAKNNSDSNKYVLSDADTYALVIKYYMTDVSEEKWNTDNFVDVSHNNINEDIKIKVAAPNPSSEKQKELEW